MPRILVVDDEPDILQLIKRYAEHDGYEAVCAEDGLSAVKLCENEDFDVIVMDVMMPEMDGYHACKRIREKKDIPVLMLSARGEEYDKLFGFEVGADDYVTKPFSPKELMARINVIIKRHGKPGAEQKPVQLLQFGGLVINIDGHAVSVDGSDVTLTAKEYDLLIYLSTNAGIALTKEQILNAVWGYDYFGDDSTVYWQIKLLRGKLGKYRDCIRTIRGVGYKFEPQE